MSLGAGNYATVAPPRGIKEGFAKQAKGNKIIINCNDFFQCFLCATLCLCLSLIVSNLNFRLKLGSGSLNYYSKYIFSGKCDYYRIRSYVGIKL